MQVLIPLDKESGNSYVFDLVKRMGNDANVFIGIDYFYDFNLSFDIIHIQWPEAFFNWQVPTDEQLKDLDDNLQRWQGKKSKIVITLHNEKSHKFNLNNQKLYEIVYKYVNAVVHLGEYSYQNFSKFFEKKGIKHSIVYHSLYVDFPNAIKRSEARKCLGIDDDKFVILCFGTLRNIDEYNLLLHAFKKIKVKNKFLLTNGWRTLFPIFKEPLKRIKHELFTSFSQISARNKLNNEFVNNENVQIYLNASDLIFISRLDTLNSGNVFLGFTFGKVVVGPESGNIGEILNKTGNPTFNPKEMDSVVAALNQGVALSKSNKGNENYEYGMKYLHPIDAAKKHLQLYNELLGIV